MDLNNIERNKLDYLLTDILPTELPELFTYRFFYEFLIDHHKEVEEIEQMIISLKNNHSNQKKLFNGAAWKNAPLKYTIMKGLDNERQISLLHPISGMEVLLFVRAYQKEILYLLEKNSVYSLRYHHRNNDLYYKNKNKSITKYFEAETKNSGRDIIEHTGMFFDIKPYNSIASFTSSEEWMLLNSKYKYFARTDYKACFDSIYTHTYTWMTANSVTDTREFNNVNIFTTIDRLLMNINTRSSNGIVVGPEFSRMIAELMLQRIDVAVHNQLLNDGKVNGVDYNVYRYVDDVFIFAKSEELVNEIISSYTESARTYLLSLNEQKLEKSRVPFILEEWHKETNLYTNRVSTLIFNSEFELRDERKKAKEKADREGTESETVCLFKAAVFHRVKSTLMSHFNNLMCIYNDKNKTIVSYVLGMLFHKVSRNKSKYTIFRKNVSARTVFSFIDFVLYVYSFFPDFNNTQKLLGILSYVKDEFDFSKREHEDIAQNIFGKYSFIFDKANISDLVNLILFYRQIKVEIPYNYECKIVELLNKNENPLLWATYLVYSTYNNKYRNEICKRIEDIIEKKIDAVRNWKEAYIYKEFWWIIIFNKCPYISNTTQALIDSAINRIGYTDPVTELSGKCNALFDEFLKTSDDQFFEWDIEKKDFLREVAFKTHERSIFKNYGNNLNFMNWTSIT